MKGRKSRDIIQFALIVAILLVLNVLGSLKFFRLDLTSENRYTLSDATKELLKDFDDQLLVKVYLKGDYPAAFQRLEQETRQMLDEFRAYNPNLQYQFINPNENETEEKTEKLKQQLQYKGLKPYQIRVNEKGGKSQKTLFPGAILNLGGKNVSAQLLVNQMGAPPAQQINASVQNLEYTLANAIRKLTIDRKPLIGFLQGHGELKPKQVADFAKSLSGTYNVDLVNSRKFKSDSITGEISLAQQQRKINRFDALIIAKPRKRFNKIDKYLLDQFVMTGGKTIWLLDAVRASMDSLTRKSQFISIPTYEQLNLSDMLFKYGVRVNSNLVMDMMAAGVSDQEKTRPWVYFPMIMPRVDHPITKDLNAIKLQFASSLDTIKTPNSKKTVLLKSSQYSTTAATPHIVSLGRLYNPPGRKRFPESEIPLGVLIEGQFESLFKNRIEPRKNGEPLKIAEQSDDNQMMVIGDGDIIRNQLNVVNANMEKGKPLPLGYDQYTGATYGNKDFLLNAVDYMLDDSGIISIRSRELKIRLLDSNQIQQSRLFWQLLNTLTPVLTILLFGLIYTVLHRRKYARKRFRS